MPIPHLLKKSLPLRKYLAPIIKKNKRKEQEKKTVQKSTFIIMSL